MKIHLIITTMFLGIVLAVHLAMNGKVGVALDNPRVGNAVFWCIGAVAAIIIGLSGWQAGALAPLRQVIHSCLPPAHSGLALFSRSRG